MAQTLETLVVKLQADVSGLRKDLQTASVFAREKVETIEDSFTGLGSVIRRVGQLGSAFYAARGVLSAVGDLAMQAQRTENALLVFGKQVQRNNIDLNDANRVVDTLSKRFGVLPSTVQEATTVMLRAGGSLDDVERALTAAGASAAAAGTDITRAFDNVSVAVATGRSELLETSGIIANLGPAQQAYAKSIGKTVEELTSQELIQARVNAIFEESKSEIEDVDELLAGLTGSLSSAQTEMSRLRNELGELLLPVVRTAVGAFADLVSATNSVLERLTDTPVEKAAREYETLKEKVEAAAGSQEALEQLLKETGDRLVDETGRTAYQATMEAIETDSKTAAEAVDLLTAALQAQVEAQRQALLLTINQDAVANAEAILRLQERIAFAQDTVREGERVAAGQAQRVKEEEALIAAGTPTGQLPNLQTNLAQGLQSVRDSQARLDALLAQLAALEAARLEIERARVEVIRPDLVDTIFGPARAPTTGPATGEGDGRAGAGGAGAGDAEAKTGEAARPLTLAEMRTEFQEMMLGPLRQDAAQRDNALYRLLLGRPGLRVPGAPDVALPRAGAGFGLPSLSAPQGLLEAPTLPTTLEVLAILDEAILSRAGNIAVDMMGQPLLGRYRDVMERMLPPDSLLPGAGPLPDRNTIEGFARAIEQESQRVLLARTGYGLDITDPSIGLVPNLLRRYPDMMDGMLPPGSLLPGAGPLPDRNTIEGFARAIEQETQRILLARTGFDFGITDPSIGILPRSLGAPADALQRALESLPAPRLRGIPGLSIPLAGEVTQSRDIGLPRAVAGPSDVIPEPTLLDEPLFNYTAEQMQAFADRSKQIAQMLADMYEQDLKAAEEIAQARANFLEYQASRLAAPTVDEEARARDRFLEYQTSRLAAPRLTPEGQAFADRIRFENLAPTIGVSTPEGIISQDDAAAIKAGADALQEAAKQSGEILVGGIVEAIETGDLKAAFQGVFDALASYATVAIAGAIGGPAGAAVGALAAAGITLFGRAVTTERPSESESERAEAERTAVSRAPSAVRIDFTFNQSNSLGLLDDPATRSRLRDVSNEAFVKFEEVLQRNLVPRLQALEGRVFA